MILPNHSQHHFSINIKYLILSLARLVTNNSGSMCVSGQSRRRELCTALTTHGWRFRTGDDQGCKPFMPKFSTRAQTSQGPPDPIQADLGAVHLGLEGALLRSQQSLGISTTRTKDDVLGWKKWTRVKTRTQIISNHAKEFTKTPALSRFNPVLRIRGRSDFRWDDWKTLGGHDV